MDALAVSGNRLAAAGRGVWHGYRERPNGLAPVEVRQQYARWVDYGSLDVVIATGDGGYYVRGDPFSPRPIRQKWRQHLIVPFETLAVELL